MVITPATSAWNEGHKKEATFQLAKLQQQVLANLLDGTLTLDHSDPEIAALLADTLEKMEASDKRYFSEQGRRRAAARKPGLPGPRRCGNGAGWRRFKTIGSLCVVFLTVLSESCH